MEPSEDRRPLFERLKSGLEEAILHAKGEITLKTTVVEMPDPPPDVRPDELTAQRIERGMSPEMFTRLLNVSVKTVQSWERGDRKPSGAAIRLIQVLRHFPQDLLAVAGLAVPSELADADARGLKQSGRAGRP